MLTAVIAGEVQIVGDPSTSSLPHIQAGKLRAIGRCRPNALPKVPDLPTMAEAGYPNCLAVLARRGGAGRHAAGHHRQAQQSVRREPCSAGDTCAPCHARRRDQGRPAG